MKNSNNDNRDKQNYKPYRTKEQRAEAQRTARIVNGTWVSNAPVSYHKEKHMRNNKDGSI